MTHRRWSQVVATCKSHHMCLWKPVPCFVAISSHSHFLTQFLWFTFRAVPRSRSSQRLKISIHRRSSRVSTLDLNSRAIETSFKFWSYVTFAVTALDTSSTELFEFPCTILIIFDTLHSPCGDDDDQKLMWLLITRPWLSIQMNCTKSDATSHLPTLNLISTGGERAEIEN